MTTSSSSSPFPSAFEAARHKLNNWLDEWYLYLAMAEIDEEEAAEASADLGEASPVRIPCKPVPFEECAPGQVRLLFPHLDTGEPFYFLVLSQWPESDRFVCCGLSPLGTPAIKSEISLSLDIPCAVAQAWNSFINEKEVLENSWVCTTLEDHERREVLALYKETMTGETTEGFSRERTGPPLGAIHDPRHLYLMEERNRVGATASRLNALEAQYRNTASVVVQFQQEAKQEPLAYAASTGEKLKTPVLLLAEENGCLQLVYSNKLEVLSRPQPDDANRESALAEWSLSGHEGQNPVWTDFLDGVSKGTYLPFVEVWDIQQNRKVGSARLDTEGECVELTHTPWEAFKNPEILKNLILVCSTAKP